MDPPEFEHRLREILATIPPPFRSAMLAVLTAPDAADRAKAIGDVGPSRDRSPLARSG